ncbi:MAG: DMT family transporter [Candidatus Woesearchaeota archaeon]
MDIKITNSAKKTGLCLIFFTAIISGFSIFINSFGVKGFDSSVFTFSKNIVVALFLFAIILGFGLKEQIRALNKKQWLQLSEIGLIGGSIPFLLFFKGLQMTTGSTSAFIHKTIFIYITIFAIIFLKERMTKGLFIGTLLLLAGNFLMLRPDFTFSIGHILILIATLFWAAENTIAKHALKDISGTIVGFGRMFFGSLFILLFLIFTGKAPIVFSMSLAQYGWILITSILLLLYVFSYYNGLRHIKLTTAACILTLGSPITLILSWVFKGSSLTIAQAFGILLIFGGILSIILYSNIGFHYLEKEKYPQSLK